MNKRVLVLLSSPLASRMAGVSRFARERGWHLMFMDRLSSRPFDWDGDGVIATIRDDKRTLAFLRRQSEKGIPIVDLTCDVPDFRCARVVADHVAAGRLAAAHFAERNIRSLVFLSLDWGHVRDRLWRGFSANAGGARVRPGVAKWCFSQDRPHARWDDWDAVSRWLSGKFAAASRPFGVFTYAQSEAVIVLQAALRAGFPVPSALAIVAGNDDPVMLESQPVPISAVDADTETGAYEAAALLQRLMDGGPSPRAQIELPPRGVVARKSTDATAVSDPLVRRALDLFLASLASKIDIAATARALGVNRNTLDRRFAAELGRTASAELHRQRLMLAKRLLADPANKVAYAARIAGFSSSSHLGTALRADIGVSPAEWKEKWS